MVACVSSLYRWPRLVFVPPMRPPSRAVKLDKMFPRGNFTHGLLTGSCDGPARERKRRNRIACGAVLPRDRLDVPGPPALHDDRSRAHGDRLVVLARSIYRCKYLTPRSALAGLGLDVGGSTESLITVNNCIHDRGG